MKVVVVGFGSIGKRHVANLIKNDISDIILYREQSKGNDLGLFETSSFSTIIDYKPDFVIVANPTFKHAIILEFLLKNDFNILCEKPIVSGIEDFIKLKKQLESYRGNARVAFNLRYHPCIDKTKVILENKLIGDPLFAKFFVGQYLPDWRETNHLESYSSHIEMGGGVVLDLIHEVDLAEYLIGNPNGVIKSIVAKISNVTINSEDIAEVIYKTSKNQIVNIHLDYLYRGYARNFLISGTKGNIKCDLFENCVSVFDQNNKVLQKHEFAEFKRNDMYNSLITDYAEELSTTHHKSKLPSFSENISVMNTTFEIKNNYGNK